MTPAEATNAKPSSWTKPPCGREGVQEPKQRNGGGRSGVMGVATAAAGRCPRASRRHACGWTTALIGNIAQYCSCMTASRTRTTLLRVVSEKDKTSFWTSLISTVHASGVVIRNRQRSTLVSHRAARLRVCLEHREEGQRQARRHQPGESRSARSRRSRMIIAKPSRDIPVS